MSKKPAIQALQANLGHRFNDIGLLESALTHASLSRSGNAENQRLEFLGDRVLGLVVAQALYQNDRHASEGQLAPRLNALVRKETCAEVASEIGVGAALQMGRSEMQSGGRRKMALLGDAMEAVIAAVYLDADFATAQKMVLTLWGSRIDQAEAQVFDPKSALQEWAQARKLAPPKYIEKSRTGPDHAPVFVIEAWLENDQSATGQASSKKLAQVEAANKLLEILKEIK